MTISNPPPQGYGATGPLLLILSSLRPAPKAARYRKSAKIDALRECKEEMLEAHRWAASAAVRGEK